MGDVPSAEPRLKRRVELPAAVAGGAFYRVHVGKVSGEEAAKEFGEKLRSREGVVPMVIRLDESFSETGNR